MTAGRLPWVPTLQASLVVVRDVASANGEHCTTTYEIAAGRRADTVEALADLIEFLWSAAEEASEPSTWRAGGAVARRTWERLVASDAGGRCPEMKAAIGEAVAWWHETECPDVVFADRPQTGTSTPYIDSISIMRCGADQTIRAVQAKVTAARPRGRVHEAFQKFERLQRGERDEFWGEAIRRLRHEVATVDGIRIDFSRHSSGTLVRHFQAFVCHATRPPTDPAHDYHPRLNAHACHGRTIALLYDPDVEGLASAVAAAVRRQVMP